MCRCGRGEGQSGGRRWRVEGKGGVRGLWRGIVTHCGALEVEEVTEVFAKPGRGDLIVI